MRRYRDRNYVGATREKLAEMLREELKRMGVSFQYFDGSSLVPVSGYWKYQDVYRWESVGLYAFHPETGKLIPMSICGWHSMTQLVRSKSIEISRAYRGFANQFEAAPR